MPPRLPYEPTSSLVRSAEPPKNPHIERKRRAHEARRARYVSEKERTRRNTKPVDPVKKAFRNAVAAALLRGDLKPGRCSWVDLGPDGHKHWCNRTPTEAHHRSYEPGHELDVRWLCKEHHDRLSSAAWKAARKAKQGLQQGGNTSLGPPEPS